MFQEGNSIEEGDPGFWMIQSDRPDLRGLCKGKSGAKIYG